jgi:DNA-binding NtrC family response regulator
MDAGKILVAGSRGVELSPWAASLEEAGFTVKQCDTPERLGAKAAEGCDVLFISLFSENEAEQWLRAAVPLRARHPLVKIAILAIESSEASAILALRAHVDEYVRGTVDGAAIVAMTRSLWGGGCGARRGTILGESHSMRDMRERLQRLAARDCNVLITGESGTGKELAAAAIHANSERRTGRMVCINCAAIPDSLVESELFGRERGAFTGADSAQDGKLKAADGGVIFLDEVGDLSLYAQAKILRAVETKEMYRLGSHKPLRVDARIVAATHRNLEEMVQQGLFRQDLFFRLNVGRVHVPPLRDRIEDLHILVSHYLEILNRQMSTCVKGFSEQAWQCLARYSWPGNVRELKNLIESLLVNTFSAMISAEDLPPQIRIGTQPAEGERDQLVSALLAANWNKSKAAERLQWSRMKLYRKMAKYAVSGATGDQVA